MAKAKTGVVIKNKMLNTVVVAVQSTRPHPLYHKTVRKTKKFHVHDEIGVKVGDKVEFNQTKPYSRTVKWAITKVISAPSKPKTQKAIAPDEVSPTKSTKEIKSKSKTKTKSKP